MNETDLLPHQVAVIHEDDDGNRDYKFCVVVAE